jgi:uncharacterized delta-60 repeat protein
MRRLVSVTNLLVLTTIFILSSAAYAQIDYSFNPVVSKATIVDPTAKGQLVMPDGKIVIWGGQLASSGQAKGQVARLNSDGSLDTTFSYCSCNLKDIDNVIAQPDGKLVVSGSDPLFKARGVRLNTDGSVDGSFQTNIPPALLGGSLKVWAVRADGKIYAEREAQIPQNNSRHLILLNSDGTTDTGFTPVIISSTSSAMVLFLSDFMILPDGKIIYSERPGGSSRQTWLIRRNGDGTNDSSWVVPDFVNAQFDATPRILGFDRQADGSFIVGGEFTTVNGVAKKNFVRIFPAGNVDLTFTAPATFTQGGMPRVLSNGQIIVTAIVTGDSKRTLHRLNSDGSEDTSRSSLGAAEAPGVQWSEAGAKQDVAESKGGERDDNVKSDFASGSTITEVQNRFVLDSSEKVLFFGTSTSPAQQFFRLNTDGSEDASFQPNVSEFGTVSTVARQRNGKTYIAGSFVQLNGVARSGFARLNYDGTEDTGFDPGTGFNTPPAVLAIQPDGKVIAGGSFTTYNGVSHPGIARINTDGTLDSSFTTTTGLVSVIVVLPDGKILIGGSFSTVSGTPRTDVARLNADGTLDASFNVVLGSGSVNSVIPESGGKITIGGTFSGVNGFNRSQLVRLNSDGSLDLSFTADSVGGVNHVWRQPNGKYIIAQNGGDAVLRRRNADGTPDGTFSSTVFKYSPSSTDARINSLVFQVNGKMIVGGQFDSVNSFSKLNMVRVGVNGGIDTVLFHPNPDGPVQAMDVQSDNKIVAVGDFSNFFATVRGGVARFSTGEAVFHTPLWDFDGDGRSDISVFRPSDGNWYLMESQAGFVVEHFGQAGDIVTSADYDGDGKSDLGIYRDGAWWHVNSSDGTLGLTNWGNPGDIPLPADWDGDGKADQIFFHPATGEWFRRGSMGFNIPVQWGIAGDVPISGDFDGDGKADPAIFRPSDGMWWVLNSSNGAASAAQWGVTGDVPVAADYDGDGKTDVAVWRPSNGAWYVFNSSNGSVSITGWGLAGDRPTPGDFDGDGKADIAIWRPSNGIWYIMQSTAGFTGMQFGLSADQAVPGELIQ